MSNQRKLIFLHLPKTGGSALVNILHQYYGLPNSALIAGDQDPGFKEAIEKDMPFIHGHFSSVLMQEAETYYKATMLRNASDRVISRYVHLAHSKEERLQKEFSSYNGFEDFLESSYADNWQTRMLAGIWHEGRVNEESYLKAIDQLLEFDWIATAADLPLAALDLSLKLGFESYYNPKVNQRASVAMWEELNDKYRPQIEALNRFDAQLVKEAHARFKRELQVPFWKRLKLALKT